MRKFLTTLLVGSLFFVAGCIIDGNNEKDKKIGELEKGLIASKKEQEDDMFKKKQECERYKDGILKEIVNTNLNEIFYSPTRKSCIYFSEGNGELNITDYLTKENLYKVTISGNNAECLGFDKQKSDSLEGTGSYSDSVITCFNRLQTKITELKGE